MSTNLTAIVLILALLACVAWFTGGDKSATRCCDDPFHGNVRVGDTLFCPVRGY